MLWIIIAGFILCICAALFGTIFGVLSAFIGFITRLWYIRKSGEPRTEELVYEPDKPVVKKTYRRTAK